MTARFSEGDRVRVRLAFPDGHIRTPSYARGKTGVVESFVGAFGNPEELAYGKAEVQQLPLYRVRFQQLELWPDYVGPRQDTAVLDLYENWLEPL